MNDRKNGRGNSFINAQFIPNIYQIIYVRKSPFYVTKIIYCLSLNINHYYEYKYPSIFRLFNDGYSSADFHSMARGDKIGKK
jgi:hypothetical protein